MQHYTSHAYLGYRHFIRTGCVFEKGMHALNDTVEMCPRNLSLFRWYSKMWILLSAYQLQNMAGLWTYIENLKCALYQFIPRFYFKPVNPFFSVPNEKYSPSKTHELSRHFITTLFFHRRNQITQGSHTFRGRLESQARNNIDKLFSTSWEKNQFLSWLTFPFAHGR